MGRKKKEITATTYRYYRWNESTKQEEVAAVVKVGENGVTQEDIILLYNMDTEQESADDKERKQKDYGFEHLCRAAGNDENLETPIDTMPNPEELEYHSALPKEVYSQLEIFLEELTEDQRELIRMSYHEQLSNCEIARQIGKTEGTVRYRLNKILKALKENFGVQDTDKD